MGGYRITRIAEERTVSNAALLRDLAGKSVAIVGNSRALADQSYGEEIDAADLVIRINRAPMPTALSHGRRCDWLALATSLSRAEAGRIDADRYLWMSHKRKRLSLWVAQSDGFYLHPLERFRSLQDVVKAPPTTGLMVIDLVASSDAAVIRLYGFDFFASLSLTGRRKPGQLPHDFAAEKTWLDRLMARDGRLASIG
ncbi:MAG: glycosyltransferase family 29 protein [Paracoccaceae bacterium]